MASWNSKVSIKCTLQNLAGSSRSSWDLWPTVFYFIFYMHSDCWHTVFRSLHSRY